MLKLILIITLGVPNVEAMQHAYADWLGYAVVQRGAVTRDLAGAWDAPAMTGRLYTLMRPESKANVYLRFVQVDPATGYVPMRTFGWNAIEMLVQDPDALAERLGAAGSPFKIIGAPRSLGPNSPIRAMQVVGPASEVLYLTRIPSSMPSHSSAQTFVDRPFIMIVGGPDLQTMRNFYSETVGLSVNTPSKARMTVLNKAYGFDLETTHPISMARISPQFSIEIDGYPANAIKRPTRTGELPPAIAMVGFEVESLESTGISLLAAPRVVTEAPYKGRRVAAARGPAGELYELIETK